MKTLAWLFAQLCCYLLQTFFILGTGIVGQRCRVFATNTTNAGRRLPPRLPLPLSNPLTALRTSSCCSRAFVMLSSTDGRQGSNSVEWRLHAQASTKPLANPARLAVAVHSCNCRPRDPRSISHRFHLRSYACPTSTMMSDTSCRRASWRTRHKSFAATSPS